MKPDYELVHRYERAAKDITYTNMRDTKKKELLHEMITAFIKEACKK